MDSSETNRSNNYVFDKVIIITGAASGFGKLITEKTLSMGARVVAADINQELLAELSPHEFLVSYKTDVTSQQQMQSLAAKAIETFGRIDVMINNAGTMPLAFYADHQQAAEAWNRCIDINFKGVLNGINAVYDQMIKQGRGHVINLSSIYGNFPVSGAGVYGATKAAVNFLGESLRLESQGKIKVTTIKPTGVPGTALGSGMINPAALSGILGANAESYMQSFAAASEGSIDPSALDPEDIQYFALAPDLLADQIVYAINQPWGVVISDLTVRASADGYVI